MYVCMYRRAEGINTSHSCLDSLSLWLVSTKATGATAAVFVKLFLLTANDWNV
jgi:hypothetical protein